MIIHRIIFVMHCQGAILIDSRRNWFALIIHCIHRSVCQAPNSRKNSLSRNSREIQYFDFKFAKHLAAMILKLCGKFHVDILTLNVHYGPKTSPINRTADQNCVSNEDPWLRQQCCRCLGYFLQQTRSRLTWWNLTLDAAESHAKY